jgi:hypothetical protein
LSDCIKKEKAQQQFSFKYNDTNRLKVKGKNNISHESQSKHSWHSYINFRQNRF